MPQRWTQSIHSIHNMNRRTVIHQGVCEQSEHTPCRISSDKQIISKHAKGCFKREERGSLFTFQVRSADELLQSSSWQKQSQVSRKSTSYVYTREEHKHLNILSWYLRGTTMNHIQYYDASCTYMYYLHKLSHEILFLDT